MVVAIFTLTYLLISGRRLKVLPLNQPPAALLGVANIIVVESARDQHGGRLLGLCEVWHPDHFLRQFGFEVIEGEEQAMPSVC